MAIHETKRRSDLEKRLQLLRRQVYGRESVASSKQYVVREEKTQKNTHTTNYQLPASQRLASTLARGEPTTDITYLHQDLLKILTLGGLAIGTQLILFFLLKNRILNLNFF